MWSLYQLQSVFAQCWVSRVMHYSLIKLIIKKETLPYASYATPPKYDSKGVWQKQNNAGQIQVNPKGLDNITQSLQWGSLIKWKSRDSKKNTTDRSRDGSHGPSYCHHMTTGSRARDSHYMIAWLVSIEGSKVSLNVIVWMYVFTFTVHTKNCFSKTNFSTFNSSIASA